MTATGLGSRVCGCVCVCVHYIILIISNKPEGAGPGNYNTGLTSTKLTINKTWESGQVSSTNLGTAKPVVPEGEEKSESNEGEGRGRRKGEEREVKCS